jgi:catechol 2,3-dioxygenase-like lactoylglutathione lyase family enzyme
VITGIDLDHVAVAAERQADLWPRYLGDLAGEYLGRGVTVGFSSAQARYANGFRLEALEPYQPERNDFLRRFLDRSGPGPHHLTFKVKDIRRALEIAEGAGFQPVSVNLSEPQWMEGFLHPKQSHGIVVQLAQSAMEWNPTPITEGVPAPRTSTPASLDHVAHGVPSISDALGLFSGVLGGQEVDAGEGWVELGWPGPGRIRLLQRPGPPALSHLSFTCERPDAVADARAQDDGTWLVEASDNLGTRLILHARG